MAPAEPNVEVLLADFRALREDPDASEWNRNWAECVLAAFSKGKLTRVQFLKHAERLDEG